MTRSSVVLPEPLGPNTAVMPSSVDVVLDASVEAGRSSATFSDSVLMRT